MEQVAITRIYGEVWNQLLQEKCLVMLLGNAIEVLGKAA